MQKFYKSHASPQRQTMRFSLSGVGEEPVLKEHNRWKKRQVGSSQLDHHSTAAQQGSIPEAHCGLRFSSIR